MMSRTNHKSLSKQVMKQQWWRQKGDQKFPPAEGLLVLRPSRTSCCCPLVDLLLWRILYTRNSQLCQRPNFRSHQPEENFNLSPSRVFEATAVISIRAINTSQSFSSRANGPQIALLAPTKTTFAHSQSYARDGTSYVSHSC